MKKLIALPAVLILVLSAIAQVASDGEIRGEVIDSSGRGLASAHIDILSRAGAVTSLGTVADRDGRYALTNLYPGLYSVQYSLKGRSTTIVNSVPVHTDNTTLIDVVLKPADGKQIEVIEYVKPLLNFQGVKIR